MKQSTVLMLICLGLSGLAQASEKDAWAQTMENSCHPLVTPAECRSHQEMLASLPESAERKAYLAQHLALLEERAKSCACSMAKNGIGLLRYR